MNGGYTNGYGGYGDDSGARSGHINGGYANGDVYNPGANARPPGGHNAPYSNGFEENKTPGPPSSLRPVEGERRRANRRSVNPGNWNRSSSRNRADEGRAAKRIDEVLLHIKRDWSFMTEERCVPVQVALRLLDDSSLGLASRKREFQETQEQLQNALRGVVNEHHQGFNSSIGTFHQIQASIQASQERVRDLKESLIVAKTNLSTAKPEYKSLASSSQNYADMLDVLNIIEQVQQVPEKLEASISDKRFLTAVDLLHDALKLIRRPELADIGALSDTKVYLSNQEISLADILIEELHNHLYLKSPYCEDRWMAYAKSNDKRTGSGPFSDAELRQMYVFLDQIDLSMPMKDDILRNPEADSFQYIYMIVESLQKLGKIEAVVDSIEERLPVELFKVVERSNTEVQQRYPNASKTPSKAVLPDELFLPETSNAPILVDFLSTVYAKFEAIAEAHRVVHDVVAGISKREAGFVNPKLTRGFKELWKLYQSEMRSLLHDYLSTGGSASSRSGQAYASEGNMFRYQRDKAKKCVFKLDQIDSGAADIKPQRDELVAVWQKFVPGLVSLSRSDTTPTMSSANIGDSSAAGHKLLVEPNVFNIGCLLPPSVMFLNRLKGIVPPNADIVVSTLSSFLNDFLINVFHPQLEYTLADFCSQSFTQLDAFQQDQNWSQVSTKPVFKGTVKFINIITAFCKMLDELTHDQIFSQLLITQMNNYYDKCNTWYNALVTRAQAESDGRRLKASAGFAETGELSAVASRLWESEDKDTSSLINEETTALINAIKRSPLEASDLISDRKGQAQLFLLYTSMKWLASRSKQLRRISEKATNSSNRRDSTMPVIKRSLTTSLLDKSSDDHNHVYLPLSSETANLFDGVVGAYQELADLALCTLHYELRCNIIHKLDQSVRGSFIYANKVETPDEDVLGLAVDLLEFDQEVKVYLQPAEHIFITRGCSNLIDSMLVHALTHSVSSMNEPGNEHLQLNTRVLYHNLLNIEPAADLSRTFALLEMFTQGPNAILTASKKDKRFDRDALATMVRLVHSEELESRDPAVVSRARNQLAEQLARLKVD